ncbi:hypothetical protein SAMN05518865_113193 [Duganella sp. CF458]|uniref:hypothetical protein n=1 Tax=Duganella sp. CF458 TaxID=1884368 RepID=UPI0008E99B1D|nr:hypothetical protein [Duganella sp. CF458]SFG54432.1 hypothetical protein SAMN05518865_113193 [Duganella sp. CF458]
MKWMVGALVVLLLLGGFWLNGGRAPTGTDPVLLGHEAYIGVWRAEGSELKITRSGRMWFERKASQEHVAEKFINMPIASISDREILGRTSEARLEVNEPPHKVGSQWVMKVNGAALVKE